MSLCRGTAPSQYLLPVLFTLYDVAKKISKIESYMLNYCQQSSSRDHLDEPDGRLQNCLQSVLCFMYALRQISLINKILVLVLHAFQYIIGAWCHPLPSPVDPGYGEMYKVTKKIVTGEEWLLLLNLLVIFLFIDFYFYF